MFPKTLRGPGKLNCDLLPPQLKWSHAPVPVNKDVLYRGLTPKVKKSNSVNALVVVEDTTPHTTLL